MPLPLELLAVLVEVLRTRAASWAELINTVEALRMKAASAAGQATASSLVVDPAAS